MMKRSEEDAATVSDDERSLRTSHSAFALFQRNWCVLLALFMVGAIFLEAVTQFGGREWSERASLARLTLSCLALGVLACWALRLRWYREVQTFFLDERGAAETAWPPALGGARWRVSIKVKDIAVALLFSVAWALFAIIALMDRTPALLLIGVLLACLGFAATERAFRRLEAQFERFDDSRP